MISQRKIEANRRNAAKSTGPRTAQGKAKVRLNAVTHGLTSATVVLPHEDEQAYQHSLEAWTSQLKAPGELGQYLVERVVRISWQLDRADTFEQARLTKRIEEAPRLFGAGHAEPVETLIARLLGTEAETTVQEHGRSRGPRRVERAGPVLVDPLAFLLRELESSSEGCRRLIAEWTRLLEWLGRLGPEGLATAEICSRLDNLQRALRLLGVRIADTGTGTVATADPLVASFLQAWQVVEGQAIVEFMEQDSEEDDDPPDEPEPEPGVMESYWAAVGVALMKLAAERCARLRSLLAGYEQSEAEARARLAFEASFDDSAEGERLHRYQARWGRSLLRTLASLEELRGRSEAGTGRGSPSDEGRMSHGCMQLDADESEGQESFEPGEETTGREDCVRDLTSDVVSSICDEPCSSEAGAGPAGGEREADSNQGSSARHQENCQNKPTEERSTGDREAVTNQGSSVRHEENCQNKATVEPSTVVGEGPRALRLVESEATGEHGPDQESDDSGPESDAATIRRSDLEMPFPPVLVVSSE
jgi:hypothetical protein